jgi:hypothetical protein
MNNENTELRFAFCLNDGGYVDDLKPRTVYQVLPDESAAKSDYLRVIDETGEDYLYPKLCSYRLNCRARSVMFYFRLLAKIYSHL